jgi:hypothetical protein
MIHLVLQPEELTLNTATRVRVEEPSPLSDVLVDSILRHDLDVAEVPIDSADKEAHDEF